MHSLQHNICLPPDQQSLKTIDTININKHNKKQKKYKKLESAWQLKTKVKFKPHEYMIDVRQDTAFLPIFWWVTECDHPLNQKFHLPNWSVSILPHKQAEDDNNNI